MLSREDDEAFLASQQIPGVSLSLNECVRIISGASAGDCGAVVALIETTPEPQYLVELSSGKDVVCRQSELERIEEPNS